MYNDVIWRHPYDDYHEVIPSLHSNSEGSMGHHRGGIASARFPWKQEKMKLWTRPSRFQAETSPHAKARI